MKLATLRLHDRTVAARVEDSSLVELGHPDVGSLLASPDSLVAAAHADGPHHDPANALFASLVAHPTKVICVGLNYRTHILEMGRELPDYPTLFCKFEDTLIGATDDIHKPSETTEFDWEAELAVVVGTEVRRASTAAAERAIAGFTVMNDITCRDWQYRTTQWLQGKNWDSTTPVGPVLATPDEVGGVRPELSINCTVNGISMQEDNTDDLLFDPVTLVEYISAMIRLNPGDIIATGTPGGVGRARKPPVYLENDDVVVTEIEGLGRLNNHVVMDE